MIEIRQALDIIAQCVRACEKIEIPITKAAGMTLAESLCSQIDVPPYRKAMMDGYAMRSTDWQPQYAFPVKGQVLAGETIGLAHLPAAAVMQIMTGAPVPDEADCVVMFEQTASLSQLAPDHSTPIARDGLDQVQAAEISIPHRPPAGQFIMKQAQITRRGDALLPAGHCLQPIDIALAIDTGNSLVNVIRQPHVAIMATGDELVSAGNSLQPGQIYNSNGAMLVQLVRQAGVEGMDLGIAPDIKSDLTKLVSLGLECDVLIMTGGVSAGVRDLVPGVLRDLGVKQQFHKVNLKPGKPVWFGTYEKADKNTLVFGLPGNPVSGFVCYQLFVKPALRALAGTGNESSFGERELSAVLTKDHQHSSDRVTFWPAMVREQPGGEHNASASYQRTIETLFWRGSSDLRTVAAANALAIFPAGEQTYQAGTVVRCLMF